MLDTTAAAAAAAAGGPYLWRALLVRDSRESYCHWRLQPPIATSANLKIMLQVWLAASYEGLPT